MSVRFGVAFGDCHAFGVRTGHAVRDGQPFGVGMRLSIHVTLAGNMRDAVRLPDRLVFGVAAGGIARQGTGEHQRQ